MLNLRTTLAAAAIAALTATSAQAVTVGLHSSNVGIDSISVSVVGNTITIDEVWTSVGIGSLEFNDLVSGQNYTVVKNITNNTGFDWISFANELLDPAGDPEDLANDPVPQPSFVPAGFSTSSDQDGLSFAQGSGIPRTSVQFADVFVDELSDARDFIDFDNGTVLNGGTDVISYGLRDNFDNQPFLLVQRPNERSVEVPVPASLALLGGGLLALGLVRRRS